MNGWKLGGGRKRKASQGKKLVLVQSKGERGIDEGKRQYLEEMRSQR